MDIFDELFNGFSREAFRLELLEEYRVGGKEEEEFRTFLGGAALPLGANADWCKDVRAWTQSGKRVIRVRILPEVFNPYLRYEIEWCYPFNISAGEDIRFLRQASFREIIPEAPDLADSWLFDDARLLEMHYTKDGTYLDEELITDSSKVKRVSSISKLLLLHSMPADQFYASYRTSSSLSGNFPR